MNNKLISVVLFEKFRELYGDEYSAPLFERYLSEVMFWDKSQYKKEFEIFCQLMILMNETNRKYDLIATAEHSFLLYLLGITKLNPLPPHYYCPKCRNMLWMSNVEFGIDLSPKQCQCGQEMEGEGFGLQEEIFWNAVHPDLVFSVDKEDYEFVKEWLGNNDYLNIRDSKEVEFAVDDKNNTEKRFTIGIITVLSECDFDNSEKVYNWNHVRKFKEVILQNYGLFLPGTRKVEVVPKSLYELIRLVAFFNTRYMEKRNMGTCISENDYLDYNEMCELLKSFYKNDIYKAPVFLEEGILLDDWCIGKYSFLIIFSKSCASLFLDDVNQILGNIDLDSK